MTSVGRWPVSRASVHCVFQLSARTVSIDATTETLDVALAAIRNAGFDPKSVSAGQAANKNAGLSELWRSVLALGLAVGAEALDFFAPDTLPFKGFGMALAVVAIWLSGISTYSKGVAALRRGQLNMNALMGVAVTGAFLIGQWPEAAMVMALYAIAELIEARSVDRARNAIKGLLDLTPETAEVRQADGTWLEVPAAEVTLEVLRAGQTRRQDTARWSGDSRKQCGQSGAGHRRKHPD